MTLEDLKSKGLFDPNSWPEDLPLPGEENVAKVSSEGGTDIYRYATVVEGVDYGMQVTVDVETCPEPEWGVVHMLGQITWYWRSDKNKIMKSDSGEFTTISF